MSFTRPYGTMTAAILLSIGTTAVAVAQQVSGDANGEAEGFVRIADGKIGSGGQRVEQAAGFRHGMAGSPCPTGTCPPSAGTGTAVDPNANCPAGNNAAGNYAAGGQYGNCPSGQCPHCRGCFHGLFGEHYCKHSPGYGYAPPAKYPLLRRGVQYNTYYPAQWYGAGGEFVQSSAPMVYQPTDTTQLGFYYKQTPFWQPYPNPLPVRPIPAQWHITPAPVRAYGYSYGYGYSGGHGGHLLHHRHARYRQNGYGMTGSCPVNGSGVPQQSSPQVMKPTEVVPPIQASPAPAETVVPDSLEPLPVETLQQVPQTSVPPTPTQDAIGPNKALLPTDSATSGHIRRIGFKS